jgi:hypothetical protein
MNTFCSIIKLKTSLKKHNKKEITGGLRDSVLDIIIHLTMIGGNLY